MSRPNILRPGGLDAVPAQPREHPGFRSLRQRLGWALGSERLGASVFVVEPGNAAFPLHYHLGEEELLVALQGSLRLRDTHGAWHELEPGDVVSFPRGESGAHQIVNAGTTPARFLSVSTNGEPDIVLYPDSGKVGVAERGPGGQGLLSFHRLQDGVDYHEGEEFTPAS